MVGRIGGSFGCGVNTCRRRFFFCLAWKSARLKGRNVATAPKAWPKRARITAKVDLVDWYKTIFELIDLRSFSNLWFWIALAVMWSTTSHWVLGVPFDMVARARKDAQAAQDLQDLVGINIRRMLYVVRVSGLWLIGIAAFVFTVLLVLGFVYWLEIAQAVFLLLAPLMIVWGLSLSTAQRISSNALEGEDLYHCLSRLRMTVQAIGMVSIFITSLWGMWQNMQVYAGWPG
jgi:hypothetical protein